MDILNRLLGIIFKDRQSASLIRETDSLLPHYSPAVTENFVALSEFKDPVVRAAIHEVKYHQNEKAVRLLSELLHTYLRHLPEETILIPIPLSKKRKRERGYNQVELVVKQAAKETENCVINDAILRIKDTTPQTSLSRSERKQNIKGAFGANQKMTLKIKDRPVLLLDDVVTTGSTMAAARAALARLEPKSIICLALAH